MKAAPEAARPGIDLAALQRRAGDPGAAFQTLLNAAQAAPIAIPLSAKPLMEAAVACGRQSVSRPLAHTLTGPSAP